MINYYHLESLRINRDLFSKMSHNTGTLCCVGGSDDADDFFRCVKISPIHILLLDMELASEETAPHAACLHLCEHIRKQTPQIKIILHSPYHQVTWLKDFFSLGVKGIISKNSSFEESLDSFFRVANGFTSICPQTKSQVVKLELGSYSSSQNIAGLPPVFTSREKNILRLLLKGYTTRAMAESLYVSEKTIEAHRSNLFKKTNVKNAAELVSFIFKSGIAV